MNGRDPELKMDLFTAGKTAQLTDNIRIVEVRIFLCGTGPDRRGARGGGKNIVLTQILFVEQFIG
jgi:hypothetical protein